MGKKSAQLNQKQADVLNWIKDGCAAGVYEDGYTHRIVARTLERRGLVTINGRGPSWTATVTDAGLSWVGEPTAEAPPPASEVDRLIARVLDAGGRLLLPDDPDVEETHEHLVRMSLGSPHRPKGKRLVMRGTGRWGDGPAEIVLVEHFDDHVDPVPVPLPAQAMHRPARILRAIADEAPKRGLQVQGRGKGQLAVTTPAGTYDVRLREIAKGRLELVVLGPEARYDGDHYRDTKTSTVEDELAEVFRSFEIYRLRAEWRQRERTREQAERRRRWEAAMAHAEARYAEHVRFEHFRKCSRDWQVIARHRAFLAAARAAADAYDGDDRDSVVTLLTDAERVLDERDPTRRPRLLVPDVPRPEPDDLTPFLNGWSPYGP